MTKKMTSTFLTLATIFGFAQDEIQSPLTLEPLPHLTQLEIARPLPKIEEKTIPNQSFGYLKMGISDSQLPKDADHSLPGLGIGYRLVSGSSAIDLSAGYNRRDIRTEDGKQSTYVYTLPKVNYFYYVSAARESSLYAGGGLGWGGIRTINGDRFTGFIPNLTIGYEMNRKAALHSFIQLDVSQAAAIAASENSLPRTYAELSFGAGF